MRKHTKGFLSAIISAALCTASMPLQVVNADIIIDHDCSGIDKGYYFEIANNDKESQPDFRVMPGGNYSCKWDNDEDFSAARALKFAAPIEYSKLGEISFKYWKRIDMENFSDSKKGYVRFGIRLHNSKGDVFDILEIDSSPDAKSITEKQDGYNKIGTLSSKEVLNDYSIFGNEDGESINVGYSIYVRKNEKGNTFLCRRDEPMSVNNDIEDYRRININDKLNAIAAAGYDLGEITDIGLFLESSYSKGEAIIYINDISIENMPEIAQDEYDDEETPIILNDYDYGERTGYYYGVMGRFPDDRMEVIAPSLFKAEWDSRENQNNREEYFERGKQYEKGQSYKAVSGSSIEYTMNFDVDGAFAVSAAAKMSSLELPLSFISTEFYIVDACSENWVPSEWAEIIGEFSAEGVEYVVYDGSIGMIGSGKMSSTKKYYFISKDAEVNGKKGTVTAKHDMAPYMKYVYGMGDPLGCPEVLTAQINGDVSKGSAELVKNEVTLSEFIPDDGEFERATRRFDIDVFSYDIYIDGLYYGKNGDNMTMKGYAGEEINCDWEKEKPSAFSSNDYEYPRDFYIGLKDINDGNGNYSINNNESLLIDYNIDMGDVTALNKNAYWGLGARIICNNADAVLSPENNDDYSGCEIFIADNWNGELTGKKIEYQEPLEVGAIESNGIKYDVILIFPQVKENNFWNVLLKRQDQSENALETEKHYAGSIDATDIIRKLKKLGLNTYNICDAFFTLEVYGNEGSAVINSVNLKKTGSVVYEEDDLQKLSSFVLGQSVDIPAGTDYDLNGDGIWDIYDLCLMRKEISKATVKDYIEPDTGWNFGMVYNVVGSGVKLYLGPDKSYDAVVSLPVGTQLTELGYQFNDNTWFFTEYNGQHGWVSINDAVESVFSGGQWGKPVIYLYPEKETDVHVELELTTSDLYTTYPKYNDGWDVTAYPDGSLLNKSDGTHHKYLFWESVNARTRFDYSKGFCVAGSETESFLKEKLTYMGMTEEEMNEFIVYWLPQMEHNAYNLITFQGDLYTETAKLDITPSPDSMLRIFMAYVPLEKAIDIEPQQLETFERKGFTVVEWGGAKVEN